MGLQLHHHHMHESKERFSSEPILHFMAKAKGQHLGTQHGAWVLPALGQHVHVELALADVISKVVHTLQRRPVKLMFNARAINKLSLGTTQKTNEKQQAWTEKNKNKNQVVFGRRKPLKLSCSYRRV